MEDSKVNEFNLINSGTFVPETLCLVSRLYLLVSSLLHVGYTFMYRGTGMDFFVNISVACAIIYFVCFLMFSVDRIRYIYMFIICLTEIYVIFHIYIVGWNYNFFVNSFVIVQLSILTSISPQGKRYNIKYPIVMFALTHAILLFLRIYDLVTDANPYIYISPRNLELFKIESLISYISTSLVCFGLIFGFLLDLNNSYKRVKQANMDLEYSATHDMLTGLINRRSIGERLGEMYDLYQKNKKKFSVIMCDIDDFKKVNDIYGHNMGDVVLKGVAKIMQEVLCSQGFVCRWGGEEMLMITPCDLKEAIDIAEKVRTSIEKEVFDNKGEKVKVTVTSGVAEINNDISVEKLIDMADDNLYKGKNSKKNCVIA